MKALEETEEHMKVKESGTLNTSEGIPLVRNAPEDAIQAGMLTTRQKVWLDSFPNEAHVENPVLYK